MFVDGVTVEYPRRGGGITGRLIRLVDFDDPGNNDWLAGLAVLDWSLGSAGCYSSATGWTSSCA